MFKIFKVMKAGEQLSSAKGWKNVQMATNALAVLLTIGATYIKDYLLVTEDQILTFSGSIVAIVNVYLTAATSRKVGVK